MSRKYWPPRTTSIGSAGARKRPPLCILPAAKSMPHGGAETQVELIHNTIAGSFMLYSCATG